jgi:hypothetical protein
MVQNTPRTSEYLSKTGQEKMTIDEFFDAVRMAKPEKRDQLVRELLPELDEDERVLAESVIGEFISVNEIIAQANA